jgi:hypothetical protein
MIIAVAAALVAAMKVEKKRTVRVQRYEWITLRVTCTESCNSRKQQSGGYLTKSF